MKISYALQPQLISLIITTLIIIGIFLTYYVFEKKQSVIKKQRHGFVLFIDFFIKEVEILVIDILGNKMRWFTPYVIYLLLYIGIGNMLSLLGFEEPITSYTVTLSLGLVSFIGIYIAGIWTQKIAFFKRYLLNPQEIISQFAPLISITFRIFGNLTAGSVIIFLFYLLTFNISNGVPVIGYINLFGGLLSPILNLYFNIFDGIVQTYIFTLLSIAYIGLEIEHGDIIKNRKLLRKASNEKKKFLFFNSKENKKDFNDIVGTANIDLIR